MEGRKTLSYLRCCSLSHNFPSATSRPYSVQGKRQDIRSCHSMFCRSQTSRCSTCFPGRDRDWQAFWHWQVSWEPSSGRNEQDRSRWKRFRRWKTSLREVGWWIKGSIAVWGSQTRHVFISRSLNVKEKPELLGRRNASTSYDSSWLGRKNRRVALLKQRAVIEIPFPHETTDRHKNGTLVRCCRRQPIHVPPNALPGHVEY